MPGQKYISRILLILFAGLVLSACADPAVRSNVTAFYTPDIRSIRGRTIAVRALPAQKDTSLEFLTYKPKIEAKLNFVGFNIVKPSDNPDYVALVSYGIEGTEQQSSTSVTSPPYFGSLGIGSSYGYGGGPFFGGNFGRTYNTRTWDEYIRFISLDIVKAETANSENPARIYESKVKSVGRCPTLAGVFDQVLEAMFRDFPGANGKTVFVSVPWDGACE